MHLLQVWAVKSDTQVLLNCRIFHLLLLRLPVRSTSVSKMLKLDGQFKGLDTQFPQEEQVSNLK